EMVMNMLRKDRYVDNTERIENMTAGHKADIRFDWKSLKAIIEVKNKNILTKEDNLKFERDIVESLQSSDPVNCALFVSLKTNEFNFRRCHDNLQLDMYNGIPVIYLYL